MTFTTSAAATAALRHLKTLKPLDGWSIETNNIGHQGGGGGVRLCRRRVPLTTNYFLDIYYDETNTKCVVGILSIPSNQRATAQILVKADGTPATTPSKTISVRGYQPGGGLANNSSRSRSNNTTTPTNDSTSTIPVLSDEQNMQILKFIGFGLGGLLLLKVVLQAAVVLYLCALPIAYLYLVQTCPADDTLDVKKELKRVMRGKHLPDDHPNKPKGFLSETLARVTASVTAEVATGLLGYEVTLISLASAATVARVRVPAARMTYYWLGANHAWHYVWSSEFPDDE
jgi:hypothetical protein